MSTNPDRRAFLKRFGAAAGVAAVEGLGGKEAAASEPERAAEQQAFYDQGLEEMRRSARTADHEIFRCFIVHPDGRPEWRDIPIEARGRDKGEDDGQSSLSIRVEEEALDAVHALAVQGCRVEQFHTHPTMRVEGAPGIGTDRVPPSSKDILASIYTTIALGSETYGALRFSVVCEEGVWEYGPTSFAAAEHLLNALFVEMPSLREAVRNAEGTRALEEYLRKRYDLGYDMPIELITDLQDPYFINNFVLDPDLAERCYDLIFVWKDDPMLTGSARDLVKALEMAYEERFRALDKIAPGTDGLIGNAPEGGNYQEYLDRWAALGIDMRFRPFPARPSPLKQEG